MTPSSINHFKQLHANLIRTGAIHDPFVVGKLVADIATSSPSNLRYAHTLFSLIPSHSLNAFIWNSMIRGHAHNPSSSSSQEAIFLYRRMLADNHCSPNNHTYPFLLKVCTHLAEICPQVGLSVHGTIIRRGFEDADPYVQTSLVNFYAACGSVETAHHLFDHCPSRDVTCWNALIKAYIRCCRYIDAIRMFRRMQDGRERGIVQADEVTMLCVVSACAHLGALDMGKWIHAYIDKKRMRLTLNLETALLSMYSRCGEIDAALSLFEDMRARDVRTWSAMINGLAINGCAKEALGLFSRMQQAGIAPDSVTFTGVLSACSHAGFVQEGLQILDDMSRLHLVTPTIEHYGCIMDLLGRAGRLDEAFDLIKEIPHELDVVLWGSLLVACRVHRNIEMGELVAKEMLKLDPCNAGALVFLSNVYASTGRWNQVEQVRLSMKERKILKPPGSSMIEMGGVVHEFLSGDNSHPHMNQIFKILDEIARLRSFEGQKPATDGISFDMDEEDKEQCLSQHSEKLAVAFGLINTSTGTTIRIVKNLRICEDCHSMMKSVSRLYRRLVIVRDRTRFHHFKDGNCSCGNYW